MLFDQTVASFRLFLPSRKRSPSNCAERIQIVDINAIHFMDGRVHVSWHGKVDNEKRPVAAHLQHWLELRSSNYRVGRGSGAHKDVQIPKLVFPVIESDGSSTDRLGQF